MADFDWSSYQNEIFDWAENGSGNARIKAVAGAGKTTTLIELARRVDGSGCFVAFNKNVQEELSRKLSDTDFIAKTVHSIGFGTLGYNTDKNMTVNGDKLKDIVDDITENMDFDVHKNTAKSDLRKLADLVRLNYPESNPNNLSDIRKVANHHGIRTREVFSLVEKVIQKSVREFERTGELDFTEMIFLPVMKNLSFYQNKWVLVDEAQDLNALQREIVSRMKRGDGRIVFVGDPNQAIYGFAGADNDSFEKIGEEFNTTDLPLSITYRCPKSHVENVQDIVPEIEPAEDAPEGTIEHGELSNINEWVKGGDYVISRTNAPLIKNAIRLVRNGTKAHVVGRNIKDRLLQISNRVDIDGFLGNLDDFYKEQKDRMGDDASESVLEEIKDRVECLKAIYKSFDVNTTSELKSHIRDLFSGGDDSVKFMTGHKAKGLENDRVIIIEPSKMPLEYPDQQDWEKAQEENLRYVALSRSTDTLIYLEK